MFSIVGNLFSFCKDVWVAIPETLGVHYSTTLPEFAGSQPVAAALDEGTSVLQKSFRD